jgi:hypothetical protein
MNRFSTFSFGRMFRMFLSHAGAWFRQNAFAGIFAAAALLLLAFLDFGRLSFSAFYFRIALLIFGCRAASSSFPELEGSGAAAWLLLPASRLEKFLSRALFCFFAVPAATFVLYSFLFPLIAAVRDLAAVPETGKWPFSLGAGVSWFVFLPAACAFFTGSVFFKKQALVKSALVLGSLLGGYAAAAALLGAWLGGGLGFWESLAGAAALFYPDPSAVSVPFPLVLTAACSPLLLVSAWIRFKELEVPHDL